MGHRRRDEALVPGGLHHLSTDAPVGVDGLTWADILIPALLEEYRLAFASREGGGHRVPHDHLPDAAGGGLADGAGGPARGESRVVGVWHSPGHIPRPPQGAAHL